VGELAVGTVAAIACAFAPLLAKRFPLAVPSIQLSLAFAFALAASLSAFVLLSVPIRSVFVNFSIFPFASGISSAVPLDTAAVTGLIAGAGLGVSVHDGKTWMTLFSAFLIHFHSSPFGELIGVD
jgi:hypothetical protein